MKRVIQGCAGLVLALVCVTTAAFGADWPQFLGESGAQGVSDGASATSGADLALRWEMRTGSTWSDMPGTPIVVGDYVYVYSAQYLRKLELSTGREVKTAQVYGAPVNQFFSNIAYGEGLIFVPCQTNNLEDGTGVDGCFFRVFDADTLEQRYVTESLGTGQMQSPVMYQDGLFVTGTYGRNGTYACFTAADEDPTRGDEVKQAVWKVESGSKYGFSFNGAAFVGGQCYFGCGSTLYVVDCQTGSARTFDIGAGYAIRSTITYSGETGRLYVAANHPTEGAAVLSYDLTADGMPDRASALEWVSHTQGGGTQSTPVVYHGRLYLGGGGGMMGSAEPFHVIDAETMEEIYSVPIQTKGSAALTTAYATQENGETVYLYLVPYAPKEGTTAQLWILTDRPGQTEAQYEAVDGVGKGQYCSQSVAVAQDGALLWFNDAGRLYCYENVAALGPGVFRDTRSHWAREQIACLAQQGLLSGVGGGNFAPDAPVTRAQSVQMLARLSGEAYADHTSSAFDDVQTDDWFAPAVAWAVERGIVTGTGARTFAPDAQITRQDMAVMLQRYVERVARNTWPLGQGVTPFADADAIAPYAQEAVAAMQGAGLLTGMADGTAFRFAPTAPATRAQAAVVLAGLSQVLDG
jgi:hypothetical protein